jgi:valyl-tRNA synthetase
VLSNPGLADNDADAPPLAPLDAALLSKLATTVELATQSMAGYEHARALEIAEQFFWSYCDDYLELVKTRAHRDDEGARSAQFALLLALDCELRLFAPFLPFVTEEVWSWSHSGSIHRADWPTTGTIWRAVEDAQVEVLDLAAEVLGYIRRAKTTAKLSLKTPASSVIVSGPRRLLDLVDLARTDVIDAGVVERLDLTETTGDVLEVEVVLAVPTN